LLTQLLLLSLILFIFYQALYKLELFAISPSFVLQEVKDGKDDWFFSDIYEQGKNKKWFSEHLIKDITGSNIGNIQSVSYLSDGKTLNITFWLNSPFNKTQPSHHVLGYFVYIDADSNNKTGWNGIDYIDSIQYINKKWNETFMETSGLGQSYRMIKGINYANSNKNETNVFFSIDLRLMNFPDRYRLVFLGQDFITDIRGNTTRLQDFVNTVHIPPPKLNITLLPSSSFNVTRGEQKTILTKIDAINSLSSIQGTLPSYYLSSNSSNGLKLTFKPNYTIVSPDGFTTSHLTIQAPKNYSSPVSINPINVKLSFPPEFFGNPAENVTQSTYLTMTIQDPLPLLKQIVNIISDISPITGLLVTIISIISGLIGLGIGNTINKIRNKGDWY
jgi:hypothetical protein